MANPIIVSCTVDTWVKVATNVTSGMIHKRTKKNSIYLQTYRETGDPAPTDINEGVELFITSDSVGISSDTNIDVYIRCIGETGSIRVDV